MMLDTLSRQLIDRYQKGFPVGARPFRMLAEELGVKEQEVIDCLRQLKSQRVISRVGPVFDHHRAGASTLAALAVPEERLTEVADFVNSFAGVNHNYEREHEFNLWFVVTACDQPTLEKILQAIDQGTGMPMLVLPMEQAYHIDLGFQLQWQDTV
ncbi:MAG: Lrp/AsnC family transcriptional regulator [Ketobacter sp.]|nr:MAG: Lrp/AsnC family transcriptional regulator [Ketobacter sp.]